MNAVPYIQTVLKLRRALHEKHPRKKIILQHDSTWSHTDRVTVEKIRTFRWETLPHSPYSSDLALSEYHLFGSVKCTISRMIRADPCTLCPYEHVLAPLLSVALYGSETWTLRRSEEKRLKTFPIWMWRKMERVQWVDRIRNETVLERVTEEIMILKLIRKRKRHWFVSLAEKKLSIEERTGRNGEREKSSWRKKSDDRQH
ncbi:hypothetical protein ANN_09329 [Periplaneta americana]|uniref:Uncharacterized protein n=1 Tax=Periplaneta americana TaxID=6978 RepID=A0ABQ8TL45_PERAM|nr:hypothetical protein ANN_09329 [Periplaneta americana]